MPIYTVHVPQAAPDLVAEADGTVFVREGFSGRAFLFGVLYLLWHRLWAAAAVWVALLLALAVAAVALHPPAFAAVALVGLMHLYLGTEGPDLVRGVLHRQGHRLRDLISAPDVGTAESVFFHRGSALPEAAPRPAPRAAPPWTPRPTSPGVIGMFPDEGGP